MLVVGLWDALIEGCLFVLLCNSALLLCGRLCSCVCRFAVHAVLPRLALPSYTFRARTQK